TRHLYGDCISAGIAGLPGVAPHRVVDGGWCSYWFYMFRGDEAALACTRDEFSRALAAEGIPNNAGYIPQPVYMQPMFQQRQAYLGSHFPFDLAETHYERGNCPVAEDILRTAITMPVNEFFSPQDIDDVVRGVRKVATCYAR